MFAKLTALVGGGYTFPYNVVEEPYPAAWGQWTHHQGTSKDDGSPVSVFKMSSVDPADRRLAIARNGIKRLKMVRPCPAVNQSQHLDSPLSPEHTPVHLLCMLQLRHPNVLAFKDSAEVQEKGSTVIYLVTQAVKPLKMVLEELNLGGKHKWVLLLLLNCVATGTGMR